MQSAPAVQGRGLLDAAAMRNADMCNAALCSAGLFGTQFAQCILYEGQFAKLYYAYKIGNITPQRVLWRNYMRRPSVKQVSLRALLAHMGRLKLAQRRKLSKVGQAILARLFV